MSVPRVSLLSRRLAAGCSASSSSCYFTPLQQKKSGPPAFACLFRFRSWGYDRNGAAVIVHFLVGLYCYTFARAVVGADEDKAERALARHGRERSFAHAKGQRLRHFVPA